MNKYFIEEIIFSKFGQKRHGWTKNCQIVTYFSFLPTMTFFFLMSWLMNIYQIFN